MFVHTGAFLEFIPYFVVAQDRIPIAVGAFFVSLVLGGASGPMRSNSNPLIWLIFEVIFGRFGDRLDRPGRPRVDLIFRGFLMAFFVGALALTGAKWAKNLIHAMPYPLIAEGMIVSAFLCVGAMWRMATALQRAMGAQKPVIGAYRTLAVTARLNLSIADNAAITRAAIGTMARGMDKGIVAPIVLYVIGGIPLVFFYSAISFMAFRWNKNGFSDGFGVVSGAIDAVLGVFSNILTAFLIFLASIVTPTAGIARGFMGLCGKFYYFQGGYPVSVLAYALNITLGGPVQDIDGNGILGPWIGPKGATAQNDHRHLRRVMVMIAAAQAIFLGVMCGAFLV
jgi:adenosylcobinamide-phosphate synthase